MVEFLRWESLIMSLDIVDNIFILEVEYCEIVESVCGIVFMNDSALCLQYQIL